MSANKEDPIADILKKIAPGTPIREGLDNILKAKTGALIVMDDAKETLELVDGGFYINEDYISSKLYCLHISFLWLYVNENHSKNFKTNSDVIHSLP